MKSLLAILGLALAACGSADRAYPPPKNTVCLTSGLVPAQESLEDYGTTYSPGIDGPAAALPTKPRVSKCPDTAPTGGGERSN